MAPFACLQDLKQEVSQEVGGASRLFPVTWERAKVTSQRAHSQFCIRPSEKWWSLPAPFLIDGLRTVIPAQRLGTTWHLQSLWQQPDDQLASFLFLPEGQKPASRGGSLKFSDGSSKLLSGHKFQDKHVSLSAGRLLLYRDVKVSKLLFSAKSTRRSFL